MRLENCKNKKKQLVFYNSIKELISDYLSLIVVDARDRESYHNDLNKKIRRITLLLILVKLRQYQPNLSFLIQVVIEVILVLKRIINALRN